MAKAARGGCESARTSVVESARLYMRKSDSEPAKSEPPFEDRSPLQPMRSVEAEAAGSVIVAACANTSAPSRKPESE